MAKLLYVCVSLNKHTLVELLGLYFSFLFLSGPDT